MLILGNEAEVALLHILVKPTLLLLHRPHLLLLLPDLLSQTLHEPQVLAPLDAGKHLPLALVDLGAQPAEHLVHSLQDLPLELVGLALLHLGLAELVLLHALVKESIDLSGFDGVEDHGVVVLQVEDALVADLGFELVDPDEGLAVSGADGRVFHKN